MWVSLIIIVLNIALVGIVVLIVMFSKNGQSRSNQININIYITIGVGLIAWLESDKGGRRGLTGEYGQLIIEYGIVATILSVLAVFIMDGEKEKKGMERVGLILLATLGIFLNGAEDLLTVYLAMEAQSLAFYTLAGLLAVTIALLALEEWAVIPFGTEAVLADINIGILYLFAVSSLEAYAVLCSGWASNRLYSFLGALRATAQMISYEVPIGLIILTVVLSAESLNLTEIVLAQQLDSAFVSGFHTEYSAVFFVLFLFIWIRTSLPIIRFDNLMHLEWKLFLPLIPIGSKFNLLNLYLFSISKSNLVLQPLASTVSTSVITKALLYFQLYLYCIHLVSSTFSIYTLFLYSLLLAVSIFVTMFFIS